jgi:hypothetical protein
MPVYRCLKDAYRAYVASGASAVINVTTPANQPAANPLTISGTYEIDRAAGVPMPVMVPVVVKNGATTKGSRMATVDPVTGAYTTTFPGGTLAAGSATATVSSNPPDPTETTVTPAFTMT